MAEVVLRRRVNAGIKTNDLYVRAVRGLLSSTMGFAAELGYEVTIVKDPTADYGDEAMHAALVVNLPNYASAMVTTDEIVASLVSLSKRSVH